MYKYLAIFVILLSCSYASINAEARNFAISPGRPTDYEMRSLPPYCKVKFKFGMNRKNPLVRKWLNVLGQDFLHVHHH